jgi:N-acetylmuramoyl-L-alanine amidase
MEANPPSTVGLKVSAVRRGIVLSAATVLCLPVVSLAGQIPVGDIVAVRVWPAAEYTRVTLEHNSGLKFSQFLVTGPDRLVVDIEGVDLNAALRDLVGKVIPNDPYISAVRVAQNKPRVVRLVFDLKVPVNPQMFELAPVADYQHRLVLDLYPLAPLPDPIASLLDERMTSPGPGQGLTDGTRRTGDLLNGRPGSQGGARAGSNSGSNGNAGTAGNAGSANSSANASANASSNGATTGKDDASLSPGSSSGGSKRPVVIALDPGHGGEDPGAIGAAGTQEKRVVLDIARRLKARIDAIPGMRAVLTRDGDYFVPLNQRVEKARRARADLMVSIHADAFIKPEARGSSVFALSERGASSVAARWLADNQNAADLIGGVNVRTQDAQLARVLFDLSTTAQISDSLKVGKAVLQELGGIAHLHKAHVEQAGFAVLKAPDIPSILIETAFISNPEEERRLADEAYQEQLAKAIVTGIHRYFQKAGAGLRL